MRPSVGEQLQRARAELRLSLKDVAQATKIQPWVLEALERDQLQTTMSPIYVKGFLSSYAKFLRLDPNALIAQLFPEPASTPVVQPVGDVAPPLESLTIDPPWGHRVPAMVIGLAAVVGLIVINPLRWIAARIPRQEASLSIATPQSIPSETILTLQPTLPLELSIVVRRPTWISVKADGRLVAHVELAAGSRETWKARRRFELIVAIPSEVDVLLNGQPISGLALAHQGRLVITHRSIKPLATSAE